MRIPTPAALLVEHPTLPVPEISSGVRLGPNTDGQLIRSLKLSRRDRFRAALQLTAAMAHLAEFDLWPSRKAIAGALLQRTSGGLSITLGDLPYPLSDAVERLGGGEGAMERLRMAALERIANAVRLAPEAIDNSREGLGLVFDGTLSHLVRELEQPVDMLTARSMWALRWNELPLPEAGVVQLWRVPRDRTARRLAGAMWCRLRRMRRSVWLRMGGDAGADSSQILSHPEPGTIILTGSISQKDLTALSSWSQQEGCSAVVVGTFPSGWPAPTPAIDGERLIRHIALAGMPPDRARRILDHRGSRFDPMEPSDREALTRAVLRAVSPRGCVPEPTVERPAEQELAGWLALSPTGLPANLVAFHTGLSVSQLEPARESLMVIHHEGRWRLPEPAPLEPDPRHLLVAGLIDVGQPMYLMHSALGGGESANVEKWARGELDRLRAIEVRELLSMLAPGALGHSVQLLVAEACLSLLDLYGARRALAGVPSDLAALHRGWLDAIDHEPGTTRRLPTQSEIQNHPRVAAEIAVIVLYDAHRKGLAAEEAAAKASVESALRNMHGLIRCRIKIEIAFSLRPMDLLKWKTVHALAGRPSALRAQLAYRRAIVHLELGRTKSAERLLGALSRSLIGPGLLGCAELDRGAVALQDGRSREAAAHHLHAYRLLWAAGFEHLTNVVLFDLAVADIDQLRVRPAKERLRELAANDPTDLFVLGEQARLALAEGDERSFRRLLTVFEDAVRDSDPRFSEGLALLRGVAALLDGEHSKAEDYLRLAGQEGLAWQALTTADSGQSQVVDRHDEWGVTRAAEFVCAIREGRQLDLPNLLTTPEPRAGLAIALAERVAGMRLALDAEIRGAAIRNLRSAGLVGWAEHMSGIREHAAGLMTALSRVVESGGVDGVETASLDLLIQSLEITGIEVLDASEGSTIWRFGGGRPGNEVRHGRLTVLPLGGDLVDGPASRLALAVLEMVLPQAPIHHEVGVEKTGFVGVSKAARSLRRELLELGPSHLPVLLVGETGVGKEVAARALHRLSGRSGALVSVNVAAIPGTLLEAELFGSVKGAFTGADRSRRGLAVTADGGTLFLDEIGDLDANLQVKLLRFLESGEVRAVGANRSQTVDVRIVSATHADLGRRMREGLFRRDLYFRIAAPEVEVPPLRIRREDIGLLRDLFEREAVSRHGLLKSVWSPEADTALQSYHWPGNVRELRQVVEVAMVRAAGSVVQRSHLTISAPGEMPEGTWEEAQQEFRRRFLTAALHRNRENRSATARELGISRQALLYHLRNLGINKGSKN
ncbi:MAG: sigma-54 dependent transcriptional regulator [Acidobacteriota bacterium]|nr:sigma-54 dependent transcriptional regulator [Acidobacteriota bacterium]